ncbi:hypothetical protein [uncultured Methanobacterium sp.]|uniref:hypothetical protein n=1 Tax=uncultured Methanobacterium sp. TaxID=176306 RepID=UPI002AA90EED|nr:hypothetical protein [uncultured Methanobacterium sp.]
MTLKLPILHKYTGRPIYAEEIENSEVIFAATPTSDQINLHKTNQEELAKRFITFTGTLIGSTKEYDYDVTEFKRLYRFEEKSVQIIREMEVDWEKEMEIFIKEYWEKRYYEGTKVDSFFEYFRIKYIEDFQLNPLDEIKINKELLKRIKNEFKDKFYKIHKGTPYFFIGWNSFLIKSYESAIFYLDAAIAEDKRNHGKQNTLKSGAALFFNLNSKYDEPFQRYNSSTLEDIIKPELDRFNQIGSNQLSIEDFKNFVEEMIFEKYTSTITTLYTFILEKESIIEMIQLRSINGGTIEPMVLHLFKGAVIFETLLKKYHFNDLSKKYGSKNVNNMGGILQKLEIKSFYNFNLRFCSETSLKNIFKYAKDNDNESIETAFHSICRIRNTTGHKLTWEENFSVSNYELIFKQIINGIFYLIERNK